MELTAKEEAAFTRAKEHQYVMAEPGQRNLDLAYHDYCVSAQTYYIRIQLHPLQCTECQIGEEHAALWYDFFFLRQALTPQAYQTVKEYFDRKRPGNYQDARIHLGETGGYGIVPEYTAEKLAKTLSELFNNPDTHSSERFYSVSPHILQMEQES